YNSNELSHGRSELKHNKKIKKKLSAKSSHDDKYGYTLGGIKQFNEAVVNYYKRRSSVTLDPDTEILQTMGSQEGLVHLPLAFCNEGDIVLTTNPAYVAYEAGIKLAGAVPYEMPLRGGNDFLTMLCD